MTHLTESAVESAALAWLESLGWQIAHGPDIAPDTLLAERRDYSEVVFLQLLRNALLSEFISGEMRVNKDEEKFLKEQDL